MQRLILDKWQQEVLDTPGNLLLLSGRRVGKSEILSIDAAEYAANNPKQSILVISHSERQAYWLFEKILDHFYIYHKSMIAKGKHKPTKSQLKLTNGSIIRCLPTGTNGSSIRGIQANRIYPDECDYIEEAVWPALTPMLLTTGGVIRGGTTPNPTKEKGYVYKHMFLNPKFKTFNVSTEEVMRNRPISETWSEQQRREALEHLESEKKTMTKLQYAVEYLGQWVDNLKRFFDDGLITARSLAKREYIPRGQVFLGVDVARLGEDKTSFQLIDKVGDRFIHFYSETTSKKYTTETFDRILDLCRQYDVKKIGIDAGSGSLGVGILDFLMRETLTKNKTVALNNRARSLDAYGESKTKLFKEDMYQNLLAMMEQGVIDLLCDDEVRLSLQSVQFDVEITPGHKTVHKVFSHTNSDIVEALIRSAWLAREAKGLNFHIYHI